MRNRRRTVIACPNCRRAVKWWRGRFRCERCGWFWERVVVPIDVDELERGVLFEKGRGKEEVPF